MNRRGTALKLLVCAEIIVLILVVVLGQMKRITGGSQGKPAPSGSTQLTAPSDPQLMLSGDGEEEQPEEDFVTNPRNENSFGAQNPRPTYSDEVEAKIADMTLEEKVAQMFLVTPEALTRQTDEKVTLSGESTKKAITDYPVGGVVYAADNMVGNEQVKNLLNNIQGFSKDRIGLELFTAVAEPGGENGSPVAKMAAIEIKPGISTLGESQDTEASQKAAESIGKYLAESGFRMNLAPVADVAGMEDTSGQTFGTDPDLTAEHVKAQIRGYGEAGVVAAMGKFPGTHAVTVSEGSLPVCSRSLAEMQVSDLISFQAGIDAGAQVIQLANVTSRELTGNGGLSCSMSAQVVTILRENMGFSGVIMSDVLNDPVITAAFPEGSAAVEAVKAGVDLLYYTGDFVTAYDAVIAAVNEGALSEESIDDSVGRILTVKMSQQ